ncbi:MAG: TonB-dependent receptor, partial [Glaciecola sp.]
GLADGRNYLGNLSLEKETAHKLDLGFVMKGKNWRFMPNIFYTKIDDYILGLPSNNMPANMIAQMNGIANPLIWQNDEARLVGADFSYAHQFTPELSLTATGQYVRGKQTGSVNQDLYRIAPLSGHVSVKYAAHDYELSATATVVSSQSNVATLQNETASNGYAVFDVQGAYFFDNGFTLTLLIENLLDKQYAQHVAGISRVTSDVYPAGNKQLSPGRNIGAYITYQF